MDLKIALQGVAEFFDGDFFLIKSIVDESRVSGDHQDDECRPQFDHCVVDQDGGGITGDDFHGYVYFHIGNREYLMVEY